jgi:hypothetical protein
MFNYGTVHISVGGTQLTFDNVLDPAGVQSDINRRRMIRIAKKNEDAGSADRDRFATWLAAYHQNLAEFDVNIKPPLDPLTDQQVVIRDMDEDNAFNLDDDIDSDNLDQSGGDVDWSL